MTLPADEPCDPSRPPAAGGEGTGLPVLRTWAAMYLFVAIVFAGWVAILYALTSRFS
jgi:hypothetical protein